MYAFDFPSTSGNRFLHYFLYEFFYVRTTLILLASEGKLNDDDFNAVIQSFHKTLAHRHFEDLVDKLVGDYYGQTQQRVDPSVLIPIYARSSAADQTKKHAVLLQLLPTD